MCTQELKNLLAKPTSEATSSTAPYWTCRNRPCPTITWSPRHPTQLSSWFTFLQWHSLPLPLFFETNQAGELPIILIKEKDPDRTEQQNNMWLDSDTNTPNSPVGLGHQHGTTLTAYRMHKHPRQREPLTHNPSRVIVAELDPRDKQLRLRKTGRTWPKKTRQRLQPNTPAQKEKDHSAPSLPSLNTPHVRQLRLFTNELEPPSYPQ